MHKTLIIIDIKGPEASLAAFLPGSHFNFIKPAFLLKWYHIKVNFIVLFEKYDDSY